MLSVASLVTASGVVLFSLPACSGSDVAAAPGGATASATPQGDTRRGSALADRPLADYQGKLLEVAMDVASKPPTDPHIKNRCRFQESVVDACLTLGQPERALRYATRIDNWRRGVAYADIASWCIEHGVDADVEHYLDLANGMVVRTNKDPNQQEWRGDRVRAGIARAYVLLGEPGKAASFADGIETAEVGAVEAAKADKLDAKAADARLSELDSVFASGDLDQVHNALDNCVRFYDRFYDDAGRRASLRETVTTAHPKLPITMRIEMLMKLADVALEHHDPDEVTSLIDTTQGIVDGARWLARDRIPIDARLAALRYRAGQKAEARKKLDEALKLYDEQQEEIVDIWRAGALRPIAEAYQSMQDGANALAVYRRAVEVGVDNPNSRPRAADLTATCLSMAVDGVEPDSALWGRITAIRDGLGVPW